MSASPRAMVEFEMYVGDEVFPSVGTGGPRDEAFAMLQHYVGQYAGDGPIRIVEMHGRNKWSIHPMTGERIAKLPKGAAQ